MQKTLILLSVTLSALALAQYPSTGAAKQNDTRSSDERANPQGSTGMKQGARGDLTADDLDALARLHQDNLNEIEMGHMAQQNGQSRKVKSFGEELVKDHTLADKQLQAYAKKKGIELSSLQPKDESAKADAQSRKDQMDKLKTAKGAQFDSQFAMMMTQAHQKAVDLTQSTLSSTKDKELHSVLSKILPVLKEHLRMSQDIEKSAKTS